MNIKTFKIKLLFVFVKAFVITSKSQIVNGKKIFELDLTYISTEIVSQVFTDKIILKVDYGQNTKYFDNEQKMYLRNEDGSNLEFNSTIDALNFLYKNGFEVIETYSNKNVENGRPMYLLRKLKK